MCWIHKHIHHDLLIKGRWEERGEGGAREKRVRVSERKKGVRKCDKVEERSENASYLQFSPYFCIDACERSQT